MQPGDRLTLDCAVPSKVHTHKSLATKCENEIMRKSALTIGTVWPALVNTEMSFTFPQKLENFLTRELVV